MKITGGELNKIFKSKGKEVAAEGGKKGKRGEIFGFRKEKTGKPPRGDSFYSTLEKTIKKGT